MILYHFRRYTSLREISKESKEEMQDEGIDVKAAASASTFGKSGSASSEVKYDKKKTDKFEKAVEKIRISTVGGKPLSTGKSFVFFKPYSVCYKPSPHFRLLSAIHSILVFEQNYSTVYGRKHIKGFSRE